MKTLKFLSILFLFSILLTGCAPAQIPDSPSLKYVNDEYGIQFRYPDNLHLSERSDAESGSHIINIFRTGEEEFPCIVISVRPKQHLIFYSKGGPHFWYEESENRWVTVENKNDHFEPMNPSEEDADWQPEKKFITADSIPVYYQMNNMSDTFETDYILTNTKYAIVIMLSDAIDLKNIETERDEVYKVISTLSFTGKTRAVEAGN